MSEDVCWWCRWWCPFDEFYEDPDEPHDHGHCRHAHGAEECRMGDETCELFTDAVPPNE